MYHGTPRPPLACSQGFSDTAPHVSATTSLKQHAPSILLFPTVTHGSLPNRHHGSLPNCSTEDRDVCVLGLHPRGCFLPPCFPPIVPHCTHRLPDDDGLRTPSSRPLTPCPGRRKPRLCPSLEGCSEARSGTQSDPPPNLRSVIKITNG